MTSTMTYTLLLIGGDLCERVAARLDTNGWRCVEWPDALAGYEACL
jgi:hypothetical protein